MSKGVKRFISIILVIAMMGALTGCGSKSGGESEKSETKNEEAVKIGARDWVEQYIFMELMAYALEKNGYKAERVPDIGGTDLLQNAMEKGDIDMACNYSSSFYTSILGHDPSFDKAEVYDVSKKEMKEKYNIILLNQSDIDNSYGLFMLKSKADEMNIKTMSDLVQHTHELVFANHGGWMDGNKERLIEIYGGDFEWKDEKQFDISLRYSSVKNGEADVSTAYTTDGELNDEEIVMMEEDKEGAYEPYFAIPFVRGEILDEYPEIEDIINELFEKLTPEEMIKLNSRASIDKEDYDVVAQEWYDETFK